MFRFFITHLQEASSTSKNQQYSCIASCVQVCVLLGCWLVGNCDISYVTLYPLRAGIPAVVLTQPAVGRLLDLFPGGEAADP